jgi:transcriptional regulator with XRE-family HTH domain
MADELKRQLGLTVQAARRRAGMTQERLAALIERTPESVSNIERGLQLPTIETLVDLGRVLGVPMVDLLGRVDGGRAVTHERAQMEARLRELVRGLSDRDLTLALALAEAMTSKVS